MLSLFSIVALGIIILGVVVFGIFIYRCFVSFGRHILYASVIGLNLLYASDIACESSYIDLQLADIAVVIANYYPFFSI